MLASSKRRVVALVAALAAIGAVVIGSQAVATHAPADKVVAAGDNLTTVTENNDGQILSARIKTAKPTDLMIHVAAECTVETSHARDGKVSSNTASGYAQIYVMVDDKIVPIQSASQPPQDPAAQPSGDPEKDGATFCRRDEGYEKTDNNAACAGEAPPINVPGCERETWFQNTKSANAFNWVRLNVGNGEHVVRVMAEVEDTESASAGDVSDATAYIGNRTLIVEPTKMSNDTLILTNGSG